MVFWPWGRKRSVLHPLIEQNHDYFRLSRQDLPLTALEFVVFDSELTGMDERQDEIVALGAVRIVNMRIMAGETFHSYVRPSNLAHSESTLIHRITPNQLRAAPTLAEVLPAFLEFCGPRLLIGHYVTLDVAFLNRACQQLLGGAIRNPCLDTLRLAQAYTAKCSTNYYDFDYFQTSFALNDLSRQYGLPLFAAHDALEDALQTAYLFLYLVQKIMGPAGYTLRDLFRASNRTGFW